MVFPGASMTPIKITSTSDADGVDGRGGEETKKKESFRQVSSGKPALIPNIRLIPTSANHNNITKTAREDTFQFQISPESRQVDCLFAAN